MIDKANQIMMVFKAWIPEYLGSWFIGITLSQRRISVMFSESLFPKIVLADVHRGEGKKKRGPESRKRLAWPIAVIFLGGKLDASLHVERALTRRNTDPRRGPTGN